MESEGHEEKYRAVIDGGYPEDEPVGQRWGKVEPALWGRRRSHSPTAPRCLRTARYGRQRVTSGELAKLAGGTAISESISVSERASEAESVVGQPEYNRGSAAINRVTGINVERSGRKPFERNDRQPEWAGEGGLAMMVGTRRNAR